MTKEEFYKLAINHPIIDSPSIYQLIVRTYDKEIRGYKKCRGKKEYYFEVDSRSNLYSTKEEALAAFRQYINGSGRMGQIVHSAVIERLPINLPLENSGLLEWWLYDKRGIEVDCSVCSWENGEELLLRDVYFGRSLQQIRFKEGEIVEFVQGNRAYLVVLNGVPQTIEKMWKRYENMVDKKGLEEPGTYPEPYFASSIFSDTYFFLEENGFDPDFFPYYFVKPSFKIPKNVEEELKGRYNRWREYIHSTPSNEIDRNKLKEIVRNGSYNLNS